MQHKESVNRALLAGSAKNPSIYFPYKSFMSTMAIEYKYCEYSIFIHVKKINKKKMNLDM